MSARCLAIELPVVGSMGHQPRGAQLSRAAGVSSALVGLLIVAHRTGRDRGDPGRVAGTAADCRAARTGRA